MKIAWIIIKKAFVNKELFHEQEILPIDHSV